MLVGERRVGEAVTEHERTAAQGGPDHLSNELGSSRFEDQQLCPAVEHPGGLQRLSQSLPERRATWFTAGDDLMTGGFGALD